jgi:RNA polymerase sigma-70 factor, ECF subfamily
MGLTLMEASGLPAANDQSAVRSAGALHAAGAAQLSRQAQAVGGSDDLAKALPGLLPRLWRFAVRLSGDHHAAEDLVQRACVRGLERRHQLQPGTSAQSWMFSIVHSVWLNEVRARRIRQHASMQWSDELAETIADESCADPETQALHRQVITAVEKLPEAQRVVMLLVAVEGLSYREAAEALDVPVGTVMSRLARARLTIGQAFTPGSAQLAGAARAPA